MKEIVVVTLAKGMDVVRGGAGHHGSKNKNG
jgi:hypothetical protein